MGISIEKRYVAIETIDWIGINAESLGFTKGEIEEYMKIYPLPKDPSYLKQDIINNFTQSKGLLIFPDNITEEMRTYLEEMIWVLE